MKLSLNADEYWSLDPDVREQVNEWTDREGIDRDRVRSVAMVPAERPEVDIERIPDPIRLTPDGSEFIVDVETRQVGTPPPWLSWSVPMSPRHVQQKIAGHT